jgi:cysteine-rich repeat protein
MDGCTKAKLATLVVFGAWMASAQATFAHGGRLPFDTWGGFAGDVLRCQRVIAQAAAQCATRAWAARRACRETALSGGTCDATATADRIAVARRTAQDAVDDACSERQAISLQYLGTFDLQQDLISFCRDWERAADSGVFGPPASDATCSLAAADAATDVMQYALRARRRCMDRVAASPPGSVERSGFLETAGHRLEAAVGRAASRLAAACPQFAARYGRSPHDLMTTLATRATCVGGAFYIQDAILCPDAVCGNGVVEPNEDCDDGNAADGDACPASCVN